MGAHNISPIWIPYRLLAGYIYLYWRYTGANGYGVPQGLGGILIFSYMRRLGPILGVPNFEFQYILGVFRKISDQIYWVRGKMHIFGGYEDFVAIFFFFFFFWGGGGGHHKI